MQAYVVPQIHFQVVLDGFHRLSSKQLALIIFVDGSVQCYQVRDTCECDMQTLYVIKMGEYNIYIATCSDTTIPVQ